MFQTLEHLENPIAVLRNIKMFVKPERLIITIPYLKKSRIGMDYLRNDTGKESREDVHIFELNPEDWKLLFKYCGWEVEKEEIYYQYPKGLGLFSTVLKWLWKKKDYEGFYGVVLK